MTRPVADRLARALEDARADMALAGQAMHDAAEMRDRRAEVRAAEEYQAAWALVRRLGRRLDALVTEGPWTR